MRMTGLPLPRSLVQALHTGRLRRERGSWQLKSNVDAYGNPLETELGTVFADAVAMESASARLPRDCPVEGEDGHEAHLEAQPGCMRN